MKNRKDSRNNLTEQDLARLEELLARYKAPPEDPGFLKVTGDGAKIGAWLLNKYRALYDLICFSAEKSPSLLAENEIPLSAIDREVWANAVAMQARAYFNERFEKSVHAALQGVIGEMELNLPALIESACGRNQESSTKPKLATTKQVLEMWEMITKDHLNPKLNPKFVRDGRGGKRKSPQRKLSQEEKRDFAARVDELRPVWDFIIDFFGREEYEAECVEMLQVSGRFKALVQNVESPSPNLIKKVFHRKQYFEEEEDMPPYLSPLAYALEQTAGKF